MDELIAEPGIFAAIERWMVSRSLLDARDPLRVGMVGEPDIERNLTSMSSGIKGPAIAGM